MEILNKFCLICGWIMLIPIFVILGPPLFIGYCIYLVAESLGLLDSNYGY